MGELEIYNNKIDDFKEKVIKQEKENDKLTTRINLRKDDQE